MWAVDTMAVSQLGPVHVSHMWGTQMTADTQGKGASEDWHCLLCQCLLYGSGMVHHMQGLTWIRVWKGWADFKLVCDLKLSLMTPILKFKSTLKCLRKLNPAELLLLKMNVECSSKGHLDTKHSWCHACAWNPPVHLLRGREFGTTARGWWVWVARLWSWACRARGLCSIRAVWAAVPVPYTAKSMLLSGGRRDFFIKT